MPEPLKSLPSGSRSIVKAAVRHIVPAKPSVQGGPLAPTGSFKPRRHDAGWHWTEFFLAIFFIPLYLYRTQSLVKNLVLFMVAWIAFGQLTIWLDFGYNERVRAELVEEGNTETRQMRQLVNGDDSFHQCRIPWVNGSAPQGWPMESVYEGNNAAGWPFGKLYMFGASCSTEIGKWMFGWNGIDQDSIARKLDNRYEDAMWGYAIERRLTFSYVFLGMLAIVELVLLVPFFLVWLIYQMATNLSFSWGDE